MAVLWNQGLRKVGGRVIDSKGVRSKVFKNVVVSQVSGVRCQARQASGDQGSGNVVDCLTPKSSNLPQHRHDLLWLVPPDGHDPLFLQVDSLSFHLVQISPVTSARCTN